MKQPIFVRPLSDAERESLAAGLRSSDAFTLRRCQILLVSERGSGKDRADRTLFTGLLIPNKLRLCESCFTEIPGSSEKRRACRRWRRLPT
jgi:hypothetical protein